MTRALRMRAWLGRFGLPVWFAAWSIASVGLLVLYEFPLGLDARIYHAAAAAWLAGGNPWSAQASVYYFAGLPPTVLAFVPFTILPEDVFVVLWLGVTVASAAWIIKKLRLSWWWLLFPPLAEGIFSGNPQIVLLALLVSAWGAFLAPALKVYALVPLAGEWRWRSVGAAALVLGATVVIAPGLWQTYLGEFGRISDVLAQQAVGGFSACYRPLLLVPAVLAILALAVVALRPATQFHYSTFAMPLVGSSPAVLLLTAALAVPVRGLPAVAIIVYAAWRVLGWWRTRSGAAAQTPVETQ